MSWPQFVEEFLDGQNTNEYENVVNGNSLRIVDNNGDGKAEYVLRVDYTQDKAIGERRDVLQFNKLSLSKYEGSEFGKVTIIYGSRNPAEVMFRYQFEMWRHRRDFDLYLTVDHADETWDGEEGLVTKPFEHLEINAENTFGALCGPPVMYRFVVAEMRKKNISYDRIYMSFERHMKCGVGKCGHCQIGHQYCCIDGPVFNYWEAKNIQGSM